MNTLNQVAQFQDVRFELTAQGNWRLLDFKEMGKSGLGSETVIEDVTLIQTEGFPVQILLRITGYFSNGCPRIGQINHRLEDSHFDIVFSSNREARLLCTQALVPFKRTISLPVYGLSAGVYSYSINSRQVGDFELTTNNELQGDCEGSSACQ